MEPSVADALQAASADLAESRPPDGGSFVGEVEAPREGTLAWLAGLDTVEVCGVELPAVHRVPAGSSMFPEADGRCRVVKPDGERCRATATRRYGVCLPHAGGGGFRDAAAMSAKGHAARSRLRLRRELLGIGPARASNPRQLARLQALERAEDIAQAVWAPLDDRGLGSIERQAATLRALDATFPLASATVEVELPADAAGVEGLGWSQLQALAARMLGTGEVPG